MPAPTASRPRSTTQLPGSATGNLVIAKAAATVTLSGLDRTYDGTPKTVTAATTRKR